MPRTKKSGSVSAKGKGKIRKSSMATVMAAKGTGDSVKKPRRTHERDTAIKRIRDARCYKIGEMSTRSSMLDATQKFDNSLSFVPNDMRKSKSAIDAMMVERDRRGIRLSKLALVVRGNKRKVLLPGHVAATAEILKEMNMSHA